MSAQWIFSVTMNSLALLAFIAALTSSAVTGFLKQLLIQLKNQLVQEHVVQPRPNLPFNSGITKPIASGSTSCNLGTMFTTAAQKHDASHLWGVERPRCFGHQCGVDSSH